MRSAALRLVLCLLLLVAAALPCRAAEAPAGYGDWPAVLQRARGQTVYWRAWGGDQKVNDFIAWAAGEVRSRYGIQLRHVKEDDSAAAVTALLADKAAGRLAGGQTDLLWLNGEAFASLKAAGLLFGPITPLLPGFALVDTAGKLQTIERGPGVSVALKDPLEPHQAMIMTLKNDDMRNVTAYLDTLK